MLFDPDAGKTIEEIIQHTWEHKITRAKRAEILAIAEAAMCVFRHGRRQLNDQQMIFNIHPIGSRDVSSFSCGFVQEV